MQITVNIEKRVAFVITGLLLVVAALVVVVAYNPSGQANPAFFGHSSNEIEFDKIGTQGLSSDCPNGWECGLHTFDVYADASIRTKNLIITSGADTPDYANDDAGDANAQGQICLNGECKTAWPTSGGQSISYSLTNCEWMPDAEVGVCPSNEVMVGYDTTNGGDNAKRYCCSLQLTLS